MKSAKSDPPTPRTRNGSLEHREPQWETPASDAAETIGRLLSDDSSSLSPATWFSRARLPIVDRFRSGTTWRYRLHSHYSSGDAPRRQVYVGYDLAVMTGEELAAKRRVRLYDEDGAITLLKDY